MEKTVLQTIRNGFMVIGISATLAAGSLGITSSAEARVPDGPRFDSLSWQCGHLQDRRDAIWNEFSGASKARQNELMDDLRGIMQNWVSICQGTFGAIGVRLAPEIDLVRDPNILVTDVNLVAADDATAPAEPANPAPNRFRPGRLVK